MKSDIRRSSLRRAVVNTLISGLITAIIEIFVIVNFNMLQQVINRTGYYNSSLAGGNYGNLFWITLFVLLGMLIFCVCFVCLEDRTVRYISEISEAMSQISEGDLNTVVEVRGDNEFSEMAATLNKLAEDIKMLIEKERESEKTKNELITSVAHDLRTPLTSMIGYLELLNRNTKIPEERKKEFIAVAYNKSKRLEKLIDDLFGFTKLNYGKISMKVEKVDLVKLLSQLLDEFYPNFTENDIAYELKTTVDTLEISADGNLLARLFDNLIGNAIKYGADGKKIDVRIDKKENVAIISVINYGKVIPPGELPLIFEKFYRVEQSRAERTGGTGLGLAIAKNIVEMHGGSIEARSSLEGTVFEVKLKEDFDINKENFERIS